MFSKINCISAKEQTYNHYLITSFNIYFDTNIELNHNSTLPIFDKKSSKYTIPSILAVLFLFRPGTAILEVTFNKSLQVMLGLPCTTHCSWTEPEQSLKHAN